MNDSSTEVYFDAVTELWNTNGAGAEEGRMATTTTFVRKALDTQVDLKGRREHCAPAARVLVSLGGELGQQVRIHRNDEFALYTVSELLHESADAVVRMGLGGRRRLVSEDEEEEVGEFEGALDTKVVDQELCDEAARDAMMAAGADRVTVSIADACAQLQELAPLRRVPEPTEEAIPALR